MTLSAVERADEVCGGVCSSGGVKMIEEKRGPYDFFLGEGFLPADKKAFPLLMSYQGDTVLAEMSAALISTWFFNYNGLYKIIDGFLSIVYFCKDLPVYFTIHRPPGRPGPTGALRYLVNVLYDLSRRAGLPFLQIRCVGEPFLKEFEAIEGYTIQTEYRDNDSEYVYRPGDLLDMAGHINEDKRWRYNKCLRKTDISFKAVTSENAGLCLEVQKEWCRDKDCAICESFIGCEKRALEIMIDIFDDRFYKGVLLYSGDAPVGYGIGELLNPKVAVIYYGKSFVNDHLFYIVYTMVKMFFSGVEYVNLDSDVGNEGIRMFKTHLGVYELWRKYICTFTKEENSL
jgi:hypothetical protein